MKLAIPFLRFSVNFSTAFLITPMSEPALPRLIVLPGLDGGDLLFENLRVALAGRAGMEVVPLPVTGPQTYDGLADGLAASLPQSGDYVLLAHSFGGPLAILLAGKAKHKPKGLILGATFVRNPWPLMGGIIKAALPSFLHPKSLPVIEATLLKSGDHETAYRIYQHLSEIGVNVLSERVKTVLSCDIRKALQTLSIPVLYVQGRNDRLITAAHGQLLQATGRTVQIAKVDAPHLVFQYDMALTMETVLLPFLRSLI